MDMDNIIIIFRIIVGALLASSIPFSEPSPILSIMAQARHTIAISSSSTASPTASGQDAGNGHITSSMSVLTIIPPTPSSLLKCDPSQTEYKGKCFQALQSLPCPQGEWLVEDVSGKGRCTENKCAHLDNSAWFNGSCVKIKSEEGCPLGMRTYVYKSGIVDCDCKEGYIYNEQDNSCYEAYRKGPCKEGQVFVTSTSTNNVDRTKTTCKRNPCRIDGYYCNNEGTDAKCEQGRTGFFWGFPSIFSKTQQLSKLCIQFGSPCTKDGKGIFVLHPETNEPYCQVDLHEFGRTNTRIIGNVPIFKCAPGSRRDILGNCRTPTIIDFS